MRNHVLQVIENIAADLRRRFGRAETMRRRCGEPPDKLLMFGAETMRRYAETMRRRFPPYPPFVSPRKVARRFARSSFRLDSFQQET